MPLTENILALLLLIIVMLPLQRNYHMNLSLPKTTHRDIKHHQQDHHYHRHHQTLASSTALSAIIHLRWLTEKAVAATRGQHDHLQDHQQLTKHFHGNIKPMIQHTSMVHAFSRYSCLGYSHGETSQ